MVARAEPSSTFLPYTGHLRSMVTRIPQFLLTIFAGLITPFLIFPLLVAEGGFGGVADSKGRLLLLFGMAILLCTGISSWKPILPSIYGLQCSAACARPAS